jgi:hypothetical protein
MIGLLLWFFFKKELVLFTEHRQTYWLVNNPLNQKNYIFLRVSPFWKVIPFKSTNKTKHRIMYLLLSILNPRLIISVNWLTQRESLYRVWTKNHPQSRFVVVQHGSYQGGIVTAPSHRYTKCDVFLTWGKYFVEMFSNYNPGKKVDIVCFGNTVYNDKNRCQFQYPQREVRKIILAPSFCDEYKKEQLHLFYNQLVTLGYEVGIKPHSKQNLAGLGFSYGTTVNESSVSFLSKQTYDIVITDYSTVLIDAVFFKNRVLFFSPYTDKEETSTYYSQYLKNVFNSRQEITTKDFLEQLVCIEKQEALFESMVFMGTNNLKTIC